MNTYSIQKERKTMDYLRYTLETYPTDFHGPFTVIRDNDFDRYLEISEEKGWGSFSADEPYEAYRFVGGEVEIAKWWTRRFNEGNFDHSPFDQKRDQSHTHATLRGLR